MCYNSYKYIYFTRVCVARENYFGWEETMMAKQKRLNYLVDGVIVHTEFLKVGEKIRILKAPVRDGYVFKEWKDHPIFMPADHLNIEAVYIGGDYTLVYLVDGVEVDRALVQYGSKIDPLPAPEREGLTFSGWQGLPEIMPAHDVTASGTFSDFPFTLTLLVDDEVYATHQFSAGADLSDLPTPEREGYEFTGWGKRYKKMPASNLTMKGKFRAKEHKLIFNVDDEYRFEKLVAYGTELSAIVAPERDFHTFTGWGEVPTTMPDHDMVFNGCLSLADVDIKDKVTKIGKYAFKDCKSLEEITIPRSVMSIGIGPFRGCAELKKIKVDPKSRFFKSVDDVLFNKNKSTIIAYPANSREVQYDIPDSVTVISDWTFSECKKLNRISIPDSVEEIGEGAFSNCVLLDELEIPDSVEKIDDCAFRGCSNLEKIVIPSSVSELGWGLFDGCRETLIVYCDEGSDIWNYCRRNHIMVDAIENAVNE